MSRAKEKSKDQNQYREQFREQIKGLTAELLKERITRIDFQVQLLTGWRQRCQQELDLLLRNEEGSRDPEVPNA